MGERVVVYRSIGQESLGVAPLTRSPSSLDKLSQVIDWRPIATLLESLYPATKGEPAWPPLAMFKALLLAVWYDVSDVKLAEALDDRASFRRFCGFSGSEATPERTAFVRYRKALIAHGLDRRLFETVTAESKAKAVRVKTGTLVDATIIASAMRGGRRRALGQAQGPRRGARLQGACRRRCQHGVGREGFRDAGQRQRRARRSRCLAR